MCPSFKDRFLSPVRGGEGRGAHCKEQAAFILPNLVQHAVLVRHPLLSRIFLTLRLMRIVLRFLQQRLERSMLSSLFALDSAVLLPRPTPQWGPSVNDTFSDFYGTPIMTHENTRRIMHREI